MRHDPVAADLGRHLARQEAEDAERDELAAETARQSELVNGDPELLGEAVTTWIDGAAGPDRPLAALGQAVAEARRGHTRKLLDIYELCVEIDAAHRAREEIARRATEQLADEVHWMRQAG